MVLFCVQNICIFCIYVSTFDEKNGVVLCFEWGDQSAQNWIGWSYSFVQNSENFARVGDTCTYHVSLSPKFSTTSNIY